MSSGYTLPVLAGHIKACVTKGDKYTEKAEQFYKAAGIHLMEVRDLVKKIKGQTFEGWVEDNCSLSRRRVYDYIAIANGRTSLEELREKNAAANSEYRERSCASRDAQTSPKAQQNQRPEVKEPTPSARPDPVVIEMEGLRRDIAQSLMRLTLAQLKDVAAYVENLK